MQARARWKMSEAPGNAAVTGERDAELLRRAAEVLMNCTKVAITVKPTLDKPYPDDPRWTPWTRWMERRAREAHDLSREIRKYLADTGRREP
jgi:hypothetical protein